MSILSRAKTLVLLYGAAYAGYFTVKAFDIFKPVDKVKMKKELEKELTNKKNSLHTTEIILRNYEETIKKVQKELNEKLRAALRERNMEDESLKAWLKQLDELKYLKFMTESRLQILELDIIELEGKING